ncbi:MAG: nitroreductase family protein [Planctomycetales bacterium]|nr:nitroreductase family protein [Planctomycetales bacterium]
MSTTTEIFTKVLDTGYVEPAIETDAAAFEDVVRSRRTVRVFNDETIPEDVMRRCLDLALLAPNSSNLQPWEFYWVRDEPKKSTLADFCLGQPAAKTARELVVCVARLDTWKRNRTIMLEQLESDQVMPAAAISYYRKLVPLAYGQGPFYLLGPVKKVLVALAGLFKPTPRGPASYADMRVWAHKSTALACENLMLALRAYGFDSCPMEGIDESRVKQLLNLPRRAEVCMVISAGKRAPNGVYGKQLRFDKSMFVFEV